MKVKFYGNAFFEIITSKGVRIISDPWIQNGAYYGSWFHYPAIQLPEDFYEGIDYIFFSHLHPDHFDPPSLVHFDRKTKILISKRKNAVLHDLIKAEGFENIYVFETGVEHQVDHFRMRFWNDFGGVDSGSQNTIGFELDSSFAIFDGDISLLNINDNVPEAPSVLKIKEEYPRFTLAMLPYAGGGPYPQCFVNLNAEQKLQARANNQRRFLENFITISSILNAKYTLPCAGEYIIGGKNWECTRYVHTPTPNELKARWDKENVSSTLIMAGCCDEIFLPDGEIKRSDHSERNYTHEDRIKYAESLKDVKYSIEKVQIPEYLQLREFKLLSHLNNARSNLWKFQNRFGFFDSVNLVVNIEGFGEYLTNLSEERPFVKISENPKDSFFKVFFTYEMFFLLLTRHISWNNLEIGNHLFMERFPEAYNPNLHIMMSFFHL